MTYRILSAVRAWAAKELDQNHNAKYRKALSELVDAIETIQKFH